MRRSVMERPNLSCRVISRVARRNCSQKKHKPESVCLPYCLESGADEKRAFSPRAPFQAGGPNVSARTLISGFLLHAEVRYTKVQPERRPCRPGMSLL